MAPTTKDSDPPEDEAMLAALPAEELLARSFGWTLAEVRAMPAAARAQMGADVAGQRAFYLSLGFELDPLPPLRRG